MDKFKIYCVCGSCQTDVFSCEDLGDNKIEITYICRSCMNTEEVIHHLYKQGEI